MIEWTDYSDDLISIRIPKRLKKSQAKRWRESPSASMFKGRLEPRDPKSEMVITIDRDLDPGWVRAYRDSVRPNVIKEWMGATWRYHHYGQSVTRPGGVETKMTQINPPPHGEIHRWTIAFPLKKRWIYVDMGNGPGGLTWDQFEAIGAEIIKSVQLSN